ncbi:MAG TPA: hypothetical protein ENI68_00460, partial [Gammaproteobacteria bacterium]|nr:hypothetical protein [Gammaproteobacteria bacterium]
MQATNNSNKPSKGGWPTAGLLLALALCSQAFAAPVSYTYDNLNRLTEASYNNGQQVIAYTYDAVGNILSRTTTIAEQLAPTLTITSPLNGTVTSSASITVAGTATDAGQGDSGIATVSVNMLPADNGTATGAGTANWSLNLGLAIGTNNFTVIATDGSPSANQTTDNVTVVYLPLIADADTDGLPDVWETANSVSDPAGDPDLDGITTGEEYRAGTDPQSALSKPEGVGGVNYVLFRDHFDDGQYGDRWYLAALDPGTSYTLNEAGTELQTTVQRPVSACNRLQYASFASVDTVDAV